MNFTQEEISLMVSALHIGREEYLKAAGLVADVPRLNRQFDDQAALALKIIDRFEQE